jgi:hypothetical protein
VREIAHGIHPSILAEGGLGPALKTLAHRSPTRSCPCTGGVSEGVADVALRRAYRRCVRNVSACSTNRQQHKPICRAFMG